MRLQLEKYCETCPDFDPTHYDLCIDGKVYTRTITCEHYDRCKCICNHIKEELKNGTVE